jgi:hypothetical protein
MEDEQQLPGDEISNDSSQLNSEIGREEGQGSWDQLEIEHEEDANSEIEAGQESEEEVEPTSTENASEDEKDPEEEEETEQKNTLHGEPNRVLSFKDFFNKN